MCLIWWIARIIIPAGECGARHACTIFFGHFLSSCEKRCDFLLFPFFSLQNVAITIFTYAADMIVSFSCG